MIHEQIEAPRPIRDLCTSQWLRSHRLDKERNMQHILASGHWFFVLRRIFLRRWGLDFDPNTQKINIAPL